MFQRFIPLRPSCLHEVRSNIAFEAPTPNGYSVGLTTFNTEPMSPLPNWGSFRVARRMVGQAAKVDRGFHNYAIGKLDDVTVGRLTLNLDRDQERAALFYTVPDALLEIEGSGMLTMVSHGLKHYLAGHDQAASDDLKSQVELREREMQEVRQSIQF